VEEGKDRGMAPLAYRIVRHGVYCMPFFVNPTAASKSGCTPEDIDLLLRLIPLAYPHSRSYVRPSVEVRHAWYVEHRSPLGSCSDFALLKALAPTKNNDPDRPSTCWEEYTVPTTLGGLESKVGRLRDLTEM
jgi:CRISPR/Cas system type I-B associated protein Csh2 (Cas7 group RAMP superfamily)